MVFSKKIIRSEQLADKIPVFLCLIGLVLFSIFDWIGVAVWVVCVMLFCLILYNINLLFPLFLFLVGLTAQLPPEYHHLFSYGLTGVMILNWLFFKIFTEERLMIVNRGIFYLVIFYIGWNFISALFSEYASHGVFTTMRITVFFVVVWIYYDWLRNQERMKTLINTIISIGAVSAIFVIIEFLQSSVIIDETGLIRYSGIFTGVNALGLVLAIGIPFSLLYGIIYFPNKKGLKYLLIAMFMGVALFLTFSRSAWLAAGIACLIIMSYYKVPRAILYTSVIAIISIILLSEDVRELVVLFLRFERSISNRDILWEASTKMIRDHPLVGVGPNAIRNYMVSYSGINPNSWLGGLIFFARNNAHNFFLNMGAELGIVGIVIAIATIVLYFIHFTKASNGVTEAQQKSLLLACGAVVAGLVGRSFFEGNGFLSNGWISFDIYFWLIFCIVLRLKQINMNDSE